MGRIHIRPGLEMGYTLAGPVGAPALLLLAGAGSSRDAWVHQVNHFRGAWRVVALDHRGMGESSVVDEPGRMADLAEDAVLLLDALGLGSAHVWGLSMGGRVAQDLALGWPDRVDRVVLACTTAGENHRVGGATWEVLRDRDLSPREYADLVVPSLYGNAYRARRPHLAAAFARARERHPPDPVAIARQWEAHDGFDAWDRLPALRQRTLVLTGDEDAVVDPGNARALAERIPGAILHVVRGAGHMLQVECPDEVNRVVEGFLVAE